MTNIEQLEDHLERCVVRLSGAAFLGTGFFVAPGLVLTCGHLVSEASSNNDPISIEYAGQSYPAQITKWSRGYSNLALLQVDNSMPEHPCVYLYETVNDNDDLFCYGYPFKTPVPQSVSFKSDGITDRRQLLLKLVYACGSQSYSLDGAPVLNRTSGTVCGILRWSRADGTANRHRSTSFEFYQAGIDVLSWFLGQQHPKYQDVSTCKSRLQETREKERHGKTADTSAKRSETLEHLDKIALSELHIPFDTLCMIDGSVVPTHTIFTTFPELKNNQQAFHSTTSTWANHLTPFQQRKVGIPEPKKQTEETKGSGKSSEAEPGNRVYGTGKKWAVLVGVNTYDDHHNYSSLSICVQDVEAIRKQLIASGFEKDCITVLMDNAGQKPTRGEIIAALTARAGVTQPNDLILFYYSGHGEAKDGESYLVARDGRYMNLSSTAVSISIIKEILQDPSTTKARAKVMILDACHAGASIGKGAEPMSEEFINRVFEEAEGLAILSSCKKQERSYPWLANRRSAFTHFLLEALQGKADYGDKGFVTVQDVNKYLKDKVEAWASGRSIKQTPTLFAEMAGDIMLVKYRSRPSDLTDPNVQILLDKIKHMFYYQRSLPGDVEKWYRDVAQARPDDIITASEILEHASAQPPGNPSSLGKFIGIILGGIDMSEACVTIEFVEHVFDMAAKSLKEDIAVLDEHSGKWLQTSSGDHCIEESINILDSMKKYMGQVVGILGQPEYVGLFFGPEELLNAVDDLIYWLKELDWQFTTRRRVTPEVQREVNRYLSDVRTYAESCLRVLERMSDRGV